MGHFAERLIAVSGERGRLCVGLDPHPSLLHAWGLPQNVDGLTAFVDIATEALADRVAVVKPQSAFFERYGSRGIAVLESAIRQFSAAGALVLLDVKRGDIGSTAQAYAAAYLDPESPLCADAITVSPYLGFGALQPMIDMARLNGRGVFVLAITSNPEGASVQQARTADGRRVAQLVLDEIAQVNRGALPWGDVGAVVGATARDHGCDLTAVNGPLLAPGLGAQGAGLDDLKTVFGSAHRYVLPSWSREILRHGPGVAELRKVTDQLLRESLRVLKPAE